ncbi:hypothetical protein BDF14DRAFT_1746848 [Spinellus fusiger]|nr:hypothetical protein BDF14DRAFT_1746848 [Spinellus fusiger]
MLPPKVFSITLCMALAFPLAHSIDVGGWTSGQVTQYLDKYNIAYDRSSNSLMDTVKQYQKAAANNAKLFGDPIDHLLKTVRITLEKNKNIATLHIKDIVSMLQHELHELRIHGELTQEQVQQHLDSLHSKIMKKKYMAEADWKSVVNDINASFSHPSWYQKLLGRPAFQDDSFQYWLSGISKRLESNKELTKAQILSIGQLIKETLAHSQVTQLGSTEWWESLQNSLETEVKITSQQAKATLDTIRSDINAYKIFAVDFAGKGYDTSQEFVDLASDKLKQTGYLSQQSINDLFHTVENKLRQLWPGGFMQQNVIKKASSGTKESAYDTLKSAVLSVSADWEMSSRSAAASKSLVSATNAAGDYAASATNAAGDYAASATNAAGDYAASATNAAGDYAASGYNAAGGMFDSVSDTLYSANNRAGSAFEYATDAASASASSLEAQVTDTAASWKNSFAEYWRQAERDTWRKIGYTEAQLDWIQNTLKKSIKDKKTLARQHIAEVLATLRDYLDSVRVQSTSQIDEQMKKVENTLESWRRSTRDEL